MQPIARMKKKPPTAPPTMAPTGVGAVADVGTGLAVDEANHCVVVGVLMLEIVRLVDAIGLVVDLESVESAVVERWSGSSGQMPLLWHGLPTQHPWNSCGVARQVQYSFPEGHGGSWRGESIVDRRRGSFCAGSWREKGGWRGEDVVCGVIWWWWWWWWWWQ